MALEAKVLRIRIGCCTGAKTENTCIRLFKGKHALNTRKHLERLKQKYLLHEALVNSKSRDLVPTTMDAITYLISSKCYRGIRHKLGYPCRGQRTHTNAKTVKKIKKERFLQKISLQKRKKL